MVENILNYYYPYTSQPLTPTHPNPKPPHIPTWNISRAHVEISVLHDVVAEEGLYEFHSALRHGVSEADELRVWRAKDTGEMHQTNANAACARAESVTKTH